MTCNCQPCFPVTPPSQIPIGTIDQFGRVWDGIRWRCPTGIPEAPSDGRIYGREDQTWVPVVSATNGEVTNLTVDGTLTVDALTVLGATTFDNPVTFDGPVTLNGFLNVVGSEGVLGSLVVNNQGVGGAIEAHDTGNGDQYCMQVYSELTGFLQGFWYGGGANTAFPTANIIGTIVSDAGTGVSYNTTSDARLKENDEPFDAGPIIDALEPRRYNWRARKSVTRHGLFAQDVYAVFPEAVSKPQGEAPWMMDYSKLVPLLVAEVKALRARVKQLEK